MIILGTNSIKDTGYNVDNSLRFNDGSSDYLSKTFGSAGNQKTMTFSFWTKRSYIGSGFKAIFGCGTADGDEWIWSFRDDKLYLRWEMTNGTQGDLQTTQLFRNASAWYNIVFAIDTTQGTAENRFKWFVNGTQITNFSTAEYPSQNLDNKINGTVAQEIGRFPRISETYDGYISEFVFIDGQALDPTSFGEFDEDSGIWKPIDVSGLTFGTNGFYLDFEDSSALGNDAAGSNNFTVNNLTAIDQSTDTCTNNFCTMNPLYPDGTITFSEGNLKLTEGNSWRSAGGTMAVSTGKWFWEVSNVGNYAYIGFADIQLFSEGCSIRESFTTGAATTGRAHSVLNSDGRHYQVTSGGAQSSEYPSGATFPTFTNSIISIALNLDDNNFIFYKDGTAMNPSGTAISITAGTYIPAVSIYGNNVSYNFGSPPYSESGGNSDGNGYGNFSMAVPSGYFSLCTKNLSEYG
mgnify:CR=1 FL=1